MITKEQAMNLKYFQEIKVTFINPPLNTHSKHRQWRSNGKCKTWKTRPDEFKLPIKHGLYAYGYLTHENAHLFEVAR
jgi:hypothetical protein